MEEIPDRGHNPVSDYDGFRNRGVPFLLLSSARTPRYHTPNDQADTLHYERMASTGQWLETLLHAIDTDVQPYGFDGERIEFDDEVASFRTIIGHAIDEHTLIPGTSRWSLRKLREDAEWLEAIAGTSQVRRDRQRLESCVNSFSVFARRLLRLLSFLTLEFLFAMTSRASLPARYFISLFFQAPFHKVPIAAIRL